MPASLSDLAGSEIILPDLFAKDPGEERLVGTRIFSQGDLGFRSLATLPVAARPQRAF
jgi:hypothetical protein